MAMFHSLPSIHVKHQKNTAELESVIMPVPAEVTISMSQHIGAPCKPVVKVGDTVKVGQLIGDSEAAVSAPIHSSVSGKVKAIEQIFNARGAKSEAIVITTDGEQTIDETLTPPAIGAELEDVLVAARACGLMGLGGAGFPTSVKLAGLKSAAIDTLVINGAECEPYLTCDYRIMLEKTDLLLEGAELILRHMPGGRAVIGIENNKPKAIEKIKADAAAKGSKLEVLELKSRYPQGAEKVIVYEATGRVIPEGKLPSDVGVLVMNVGTVIKLAEYVKTGLPLTSRMVTVDGGAVAEPKNVWVPIGTKLEDIINFCGGYKGEPAEIILGGPMMGTCVADLSQPILKNNNAILAFAEPDARMESATTCIRCGRCIRHCPLRLMPSHIVAAYEAGNMERLAELKVNLCMECGCCSFGCPAHRPLVQTNKLAKAKLAAWRKAQSEKLDAKKEAVK